MVKIHIRKTDMHNFLFYFLFLSAPLANTITDMVQSYATLKENFRTNISAQQILDCYFDQCGALRNLKMNL